MYYCMVEGSEKAPKYVHRTIDLAEAEAIRLNTLLNKKVFVLEVVSIANKEKVPVYETKSVITKCNDLPF